MLGTGFKTEIEELNHTKVTQNPREPFSDILQRLTKAVQIGVIDPEIDEYL